MEEKTKKEYIKRVIEQISKLQGIDEEKHRYFSEKAIDALQQFSEGNYESILELESELIEYLEVRIRENMQENLPSTQRLSFFKRIANFFSKNKESEIDRITEMISDHTNVLEGQDKRTPVYDFFRDKICNRKIKKGEYRTVNFYDLEGREKSFKIGEDEFGISEIIIGENSIKIYRKTIGDEISASVLRSGMPEYINLIEYDEFINATTGDKTFINEFGRLVMEMSKGYLPKDIDGQFTAGKRLDKALLKNPIYIERKKSFDKAFKEYVETFTEFRRREEDKKADSDRKKEFTRRISGVESVDRLNENTEKDNKAIPRENEEERE